MRAVISFLLLDARLSLRFSVNRFLGRLCLRSLPFADEGVRATPVVCILPEMNFIARGALDREF